MRYWQIMGPDDAVGPLEIDTDCSDGPKCPFCGHEQEDDFELPDEGETDCVQCGQIFFFDTEYTRTFSTTRTRKR